MTTTHTPGPWHAIPDASEFTRLIGRFPAFDPFPIAKVSMGKTHVTDEDFAELKANACLIAAAPDLLAAVEQVLCASEDNGDMEDIDWDQLRAAIARAKGEA